MSKVVLGINIFGVDRNEKNDVRYIQCGYMDEDGFTGIISDYEGGGISNSVGFMNGKEVAEDEEAEINSEEIYNDLDSNASEVYELFSKYFIMDKNYPGFYYLKNGKKDFSIKDGFDNVYTLNGGASLEPIKTSRGMSSFG